MNEKSRVLFVLKLRHTSGGHNNHGRSKLKSAGLLNSATYAATMLQSSGKFDTKLVEVVDNNSIDREVSLFKPDVVIIEALWVVPEKFDILQNLHPSVKWIVRVHSEIPFLSGEGIAMEWIIKYLSKINVFVSFNSLRTHNDFTSYLNTIDTTKALASKLILLPNYYPVTEVSSKSSLNIKTKSELHVGCFGAIRPMKNHLIQAFAAVQFAQQNGLRCFFHINAGRVEKGDEMLKNIRHFFAGLQNKHVLVEHDWLDRDAFIELVHKMDIGLQVSMSETFNIVAADFVNGNIPIVTSKEIDWMPGLFTASPTDVNSIVKAMSRTIWLNTYMTWLINPKNSLKQYVKLSKNTWLDNLAKLC